MTRILFIALLFSSPAFAQDTIDFKVLNQRMPLNLKEKALFLLNVTPYTGVAVNKDKNGIIDRIYNFKVGQLSGDQLKYYPTGELKEKTPYVNGRRHGYYELYFESGQINSQMKFVEGSLKDTAKIWYANGNIKSLSVETMADLNMNYYVSYYENGKKDLETVGRDQKSWYPNGKRQSEGKIKYGRPDGEFKKYNEKGKLMTIEIWADGKIVETIVKREPKKKKKK